MTALIAELVQLGIGVGVCRLNDVFTEEDFGTHGWTVLSTFVVLAYQESKQKRTESPSRGRNDASGRGSAASCWGACRRLGWSSWAARRG